jgi:microcystin-dependent protein
MSDPFVAEIRIFAGNFAPTGWALCNGQLLPISQNTALFSLIGTYYGGDGKSTFALPDLQGRTPVQVGQGPGLSLYDQGQAGGINAVTLLASELPPHNHVLNAKLAAADTASPTGASWARPQYGRQGINAYSTIPGNPAVMHPAAIAPAGGGLPHNNLQPYLVLNFIIALQGIFPPRS